MRRAAVKHAIPLVCCLIFLTGCFQSIKQHSNMLNAMNGALAPVNYNKSYILNTFGSPYSKTISTADGVHKEVWTYKTNMGSRDLLFNMRPRKTRYMKITISGNIVTDVTFE